MTANPAAPAKTFRDLSGLLTIACLFTLAGGYFDANSYIAHGHVFATAQTGNIVFFGVYASAGNWTRALRHVFPILAFLLGVVAARLLGARPSRNTFHATLLCQGTEIVILAALGAIGNHMPDFSVVSLLAFVAALQNATFNSLSRWSFNSIVNTRNMQKGVGSFVLWMKNEDTENNRNATVIFGLISVSFAFGAILGALYTRAHPAHALLPCLLVTVTGFVLTWGVSQRGA
jgi:uncharacterized membrane protein YoaK (UPF0700 family)